MNENYRGRFAPSPSGPLHAGSLVAAIASYLAARARGGYWFVRMDDIDSSRTRPGAEQAILAELHRLGLNHDGPVRRQSTRLQRYAEALSALRAKNAVFDCACSRKEVGRKPYPGTCRGGLAAGRKSRSVRLRVNDEPLRFTDAARGLITCDLPTTTGDFIVRRADGVYAYHLVTVIDDSDENVSHVVRGADLLASTGPQLYLGRTLALPAAQYCHVPVLCDAHGRKLSKQNHAPATCNEPAVRLWRETLRFLGLEPPAWRPTAGLEAIKRWALERWTVD